MLYSDRQKDELEQEDFSSIHRAYYRRKMQEALLGPIISSCIHLLIILLLSTFKGEVKTPSSEVSLVVIDEPKSAELLVPEKPLDPPLSDLPVLPPVESNQPSIINTVDELDNLDFEPVEEQQSVDLAKVDIDNFGAMKPSAISNVSDRLGVRSTAKKRLQAVIDKIGSPEAQSALLSGLNWLAHHQRPDGSWGTNQGVTGLALLAFLAYGETPKSKRYGKNVSLAIQNLAESEVSSALNQYHAYPHAIKVYALSEAYIITGNYSLVKPLKDFAKVIIKGQKQAGDFDYNYKQGPRWDNSISFWNYQALKALAFTNLKIAGLEQAIAKAIPRLKQMAPYHFPYSGSENKPRGKGNAGLAAAGAWCLQFLGEGKDKYVREIVDRIDKEGRTLLSWDHAPSKWVMYAWYYQTYAMFQHGGKYWEKWAKQFEKVLMEGQNSDGSWSHEYAWGAGKNIEQKAYQTAMASLMLTVYYRYSAFGKSVKSERSTNGEEEIDIFL